MDDPTFLLEPITEDDVGSWYEMRNGNYVCIEGTHIGKNHIGINYLDGSFGTRNRFDGRYSGLFIDLYDLIRKLDPIEVNLLRLEQKLIK